MASDAKSSKQSVKTLSFPVLANKHQLDWLTSCHRAWHLLLLVPDLIRHRIKIGPGNHYTNTFGRNTVVVSDALSRPSAMGDNYLCLSKAFRLMCNSFCCGTVIEGCAIACKQLAQRHVYEEPFLHGVVPDHRRRKQLKAVDDSSTGNCLHAM